MLRPKPLLFMRVIGVDRVKTIDGVSREIRFKFGNYQRFGSCLEV